MADWGTTAWMAQPTRFVSGMGATAQHANVFPQHGAVNAEPNGTIRFVLFADPLPGGVTITINGESAFAGGVGVNGYVGRSIQRYGRLYFLLQPPAPLPFGQRVDVVTNTGLAWTFYVRKDTSSYAGNNLLAPEAWLLEPFDRFLDFEPVRQMLLQQALRSPVENPENVAARALYQLAFDTEISSVLNPLFLPDRGALDVYVPSKRPTLEIDAVLAGYSARVDAGLEQLISEGALTREHRNNFADYRTSMLYTYRVSAVVVLLFYARAIEVAINSGTIDDPRILTIDYNPLTVDGSMLTL
jgi:hypothetical protein